MKTKLFYAIAFISAISYGQTFEWETAAIQGNSSFPNSFATETISGVNAGFRAENNTTILLQPGGGQGTSGNSVINQQFEPAVYLSFFPGVDIQSIEVYDVSTSGGWEIIPENVGTGSSVMVSQGVNAQTVTLNWTNVQLIKIQPVTSGLQDNFGLDAIVFSPCIVNIPDVNWKQELLATPSINTNNDTEIQCSEAAAVTGALNVFGPNILDLTGIEAFTQVTQLFAPGVGLTTIDVSLNPLLEAIDFQQNNLTTIDLSSNSALEFVDLGSNSLSELNIANGTNGIITTFNATSNPALTCIQIDPGFIPPTTFWSKDGVASYSDNCSAVCTINIPDANFKAALLANTAINTNGNSEIECSEASAFAGEIDVNNQNISDLTGIEAFTEITQLEVNGNTLTSFNISQNTKLTLLNVASCQLPTLDLSTNLLLETLWAQVNQFTSIDVSLNTNLTLISVGSNPLLDSLNVANGNNSNIPGTNFGANNNPSLSCITVDNVAYSTMNWNFVDAQTSFNTNCATLSVADFSLDSVSLYPNPTTSVLNIKMKQNLKQATIYSVLGVQVLRSTSKAINIANLKTGLYLIIIEDETGNVATKRFIKQ